MRVRLASRLGLAAVLAATVASASAAETAKPRFTLDSSQDGFVRLDTQTGTVTHCHANQGTWACDAILAGDSGVGARLDALALDVARLRAATAALDPRVAHVADVGAPGAEPAARVVPPAAPSAIAPAPGRSALTRAAGRIVGRFLTIVRQLKHGKDDVKAAPTPS
jgi:hypothetical protein